VLRFYMLSANPPWEDLRFSWKGVDIVARMLNVLWNVHVFATTYMALDEFDPKKIDMERVRENFMPEDSWMISRINSVTRDATKAFQGFDLHHATRTLSSFVLEDLSRWYVRLVRERIWIERDDPRKLAAYVVLYQAIHTLIRLLAPIMPYVVEVMYRDLVKAADTGALESVHMLPWPSIDEQAIDAELERGMNIVRAFVEGGAAARQQARLKLRWPVSKAVIRASSEVKSALQGLQGVLQGQLNCKELVLLGPEEQSAEFRLVAKPDAQRLQERLRGFTQPVINTIQKIDAFRLRAGLQRYGFVGLQIEGRKVSVSSEELSFEEELPEGFTAASTEFGRIAIDARMTPELQAECLARELVRRLQTMRKEMDLAMEEWVDVVVGTEEERHIKLLATQQGYLSREVRVRNLRICRASEVDEPGYVKEWNVDGDRFKLLVKRPPA